MVSIPSVVLYIAYVAHCATGFLYDTVGPVCYDCDPAYSPTSCYHSRRCSYSQKCYAEELISPDRRRVYRFGCISSHACSSSGFGTLCFGCCQGSRCNKNICTASAASPIRLVNGPSAREGRLEIFHNNVWGTVCDDGFGIAASRVACRQLGRPSIGAVRISSSSYSQRTNQIWLDDVTCTGYENALSQCRHSGWGTHNCGHSEDVAVRCGTYVRLVGSTSQGRVEVYHAGQWGTVCDDSFGVEEALVVCRELGYYGSVSFRGSAAFGQGSGKIWLDQVHCIGNEDRLSECGHAGWDRHDCSHAEDVGVICSR